jgi:para-aminobenzoate synthetase component I
MTAVFGVLDELLRGLPKAPRGVFTQRLPIAESFVDLAGRFADQPGTVALLSGGDVDSSRYHVLGIAPWLTVREQAGTVVIDSPQGSRSAEVDPFALLHALVERYRLPDAVAPLSAGLLGYLAYDLKDCLERLPCQSRDDLGLPRLFLVAPSLLLVHDRHERTTTACLPILDDGEDGARQRLADFTRALGRPAAPRPALTRAATLASGFSRGAYLTAVETIRDYIVRGDVYQVNLSQRFEVPFHGDAFALFAQLYAANPAPFFAFVQAGDHQIVSTSPERLVRVRDGTVEARPIKGTRPRGGDPDADRRLRRDLESSAKDEAELSMIVDLVRNDLGKVCAPGTVEVVEHKRVEAYANVYHLISVVRGVLASGRGAIDVVRASFPGGSITGCPKIRAMAIIDELEPVRRHLYTGSIGYLGFGGTLDLSVAIRTVTIARGRLVFSVGGGIVFDSKATDEYDETLHKGRTVINLLAGAEAQAACTRP